MPKSIAKEENLKYNKRYKHKMDDHVTHEIDVMFFYMSTVQWSQWSSIYYLLLSTVRQVQITVNSMWALGPWTVSLSFMLLFDPTLGPSSGHYFNTSGIGAMGLQFRLFPLDTHTNNLRGSNAQFLYRHFPNYSIQILIWPTAQNFCCVVSWSTRFLYLTMRSEHMVHGPFHSDSQRSYMLCIPVMF